MVNVSRIQACIRTYDVLYSLFFSLFICRRLCWVFVAVCGLSPVAETRGSSLVSGLWASCGGSRALPGHSLSSCGWRASWRRGVWNLLRSRIEPVSPVLAGGFLSTVPPGSLYILNMYDLLYVIFSHKTGGGELCLLGTFSRTALLWGS